MNRRRFLSALGVLGLPLVLGSCEHGETPLCVAGHVWPGYEFMFMAQRDGWFSERDIKLIETSSATESLTLMEQGQVDAVALTLDEMLGARTRGMPLIAVLVFDISMGADVLLAKPAIENMTQLKDKSIAYEPSGVGALMLHEALQAAGLSVDEVKTVAVTFDKHEQVWHSGVVDALITFEPVASRLEGEGAKRLFDSSQIPNTIIDVLAVTPKAVKHKSKALRLLIAAHFRSLHNFRKNPYDTVYRMAELLHLPPKAVLEAYTGLELPGIYRNRKLLREEDSPLGSTATQLSDFLFRAGILPARLKDFSKLTTADFLPREATP